VFSIDKVMRSTSTFYMFHVFLETYVLFCRALGWLANDLE